MIPQALHTVHKRQQPQKEALPTTPVYGTMIGSLFQNFLLSSTQGAVRSDAISRMAWGAPALHSHVVMVLPLDYVQGARLSVVCFSHFSLLPACGARPAPKDLFPPHSRGGGGNNTNTQSPLRAENGGTKAENTGDHKDTHGGTP